MLFNRLLITVLLPGLFFLICGIVLLSVTPTTIARVVGGVLLGLAGLMFVVVAFVKTNQQRLCANIINDPIQVYAYKNLGVC